MAAFLIVQECVVLALVALLIALWWSTRKVSKERAAESEYRAELVRRLHVAYGVATKELAAWRGISLYVSHCATAMPGPADYAAVNGSGTPKSRQTSPWHQKIDEYVGSLQDMTDSRFDGPRGPREWRVDMHTHGPRYDPYGGNGRPRAHVSTRFDVPVQELGSAGARVLVELCGVPPRFDYPNFDDELDELVTIGGWYHELPTKQPAATVAGEITTEEISSDH